MEKKRRRGKRKLPERYRPLAAVCELANLIDDEQIRIVRNADDVASIRPGLSPAEKTAAVVALNAAAATFGEVERTVFDEHPAALAHLEALTERQFARTKHTPDGNLCRVIIDARAVLREAAQLVGPEGTTLTLPVSTPATLGIADGALRLVTRPAWMWLVNELDGLPVGRLRTCERCGNLYIAARVDQLGCSPSCGDVLYARKYRNPDYRGKNRPRSKQQIIRKALQTLRRKS